MQLYIENLSLIIIHLFAFYQLQKINYVDMRCIIYTKRKKKHFYSIVKEAFSLIFQLKLFIIM